MVSKEIVPSPAEPKDTVREVIEQEVIERLKHWTTV